MIARGEYNDIWQFSSIKPQLIWTHDVDGIAPPDLRRVVWIAPADDATLATLGSAAFRRVEATAGAPPTRVALAFAAPKRFRTDEKGEKEDARDGAAA